MHVSLSAVEGLVLAGERQVLLELVGLVLVVQDDEKVGEESAIVQVLDRFRARFAESFGDEASRLKYQ